MNRMVLRKKPVSFLNAVVAFAVALAFFAPSLPAVDVETFDDTIVSIIPYSQTANNGENNTTVRIYPRVQAVNKGETFNVSIRVKPGEPIIGINVGMLSFDPTFLRLNSVIEGDIFDPYDTFTSGVVNNTNGTVTGIVGSTLLSNATTSPGAFCHISFTAQEKIGTSFLYLKDVVVTNISGVEILAIVNDGEVAIGWSVTLDFNESSGKNDYVVFGEATTANDGQPHDSYDRPKSPPPIEPYIRAWFDDGLLTPYNLLLKDYRWYPDAEKTWDLYAQWKCYSPDPTSITISWDMNEFDDCEYDSVILTRYNPFPIQDPVGWEFAANMFAENNYVYAPRDLSGWLIDHFRINATMDTTPPEITDVSIRVSDPIDTEPSFGWENISCTVIDTCVGVKDVKLRVINDTTTEYTMINIPETNAYYYNTTLTDAGNYSYHIWATDFNSNPNITAPDELFALPSNWDVDINGKAHFSDLMAVIRMYGDIGPDGWVREDVDNNGKAHFSDLMEIIRHYGEEW